MYRISYHPRTVKFFQKLPREDSQRLLQKIDQLARDPYSGTFDIKKLATTQKSYRLRVGNLRVVYETDSEGKCVYIHEINWRGSIY